MSQRLTPDPELEGLIQQLNDSARATESIPVETLPQGAGDALPARAGVVRWTLPDRSDEGVEWMDRLLAVARDALASDLLLVAGAPPALRVNGRLRPAGERALVDSATAALCAALVPNSLRGRLLTRGFADFAFTRRGLGRFRTNVHRERGQWSASVRLLPETAPDLKDLNLPDSIAGFAELDYGLVLVTGPTGCGKSTTLAALTRMILARRRVHLITIEDPVEYEHPHGNSVVEHVQIGRDAHSFAEALRAALRQDPDVLIVGEMREPESISMAITAAETGHLVLSTLHTGDAPQTIHRILDSYPANQIDLVRVQLSVSLAGIVSQQLLPREDGSGRVPAAEVLRVTHAVRNLIRRDKIAQIRSQISLESAGMLSLDTSLARLVRSGLVDRAEARARARVPEEFDGQLLRGEPGA